MKQSSSQSQSKPNTVRWASGSGQQQKSEPTLKLSAHQPQQKQQTSPKQKAAQQSSSQSQRPDSSTSNNNNNSTNKNNNTRSSSDEGSSGATKSLTTGKRNSPITTAHPSARTFQYESFLVFDWNEYLQVRFLLSRSIFYLKKN